MKAKYLVKASKNKEKIENGNEMKTNIYWKLTKTKKNEIKIKAKL